MHGLHENTKLFLIYEIKPKKTPFLKNSRQLLYFVRTYSASTRLFKKQSMVLCRDEQVFDPIIMR